MKSEYFIAVLVDRTDVFDKWQRNISLQIDTFQSSACQQDKYTQKSVEIKYVPIIDVNSHRGYRFDGLLSITDEMDNDKLNSILPAIE